MRGSTEEARRRPSQDRSRYLVEIIFEAASKLLSSGPVERITTVRIAEVAGVSVGSLYQYFNNKESVLRGLVERQLREDIQQIMDAMDRLRGESLPELMRGVVETATDLHRHDRKAHGRVLLLVPILGRFAFVRQAIAEMRAVASRALEQRRDALRDGDLELMTFISTSAVEGLVNAAILERPELLDDPRFVDEVTLLVTRYLSRDRDATPR